jgi:hypothetical protein
MASQTIASNRALCLSLSLWGVNLGRDHNDATRALEEDDNPKEKERTGHSDNRSHGAIRSGVCRGVIALLSTAIRSLRETRDPPPPAGWPAICVSRWDASTVVLDW